MKYKRFINRLVNDHYRSAVAIDADGTHHPVHRIYYANNIVLCRFISGRIMPIDDSFEPIQGDNHQITLHQPHGTQLVVMMK